MDVQRLKLQDPAGPAVFLQDKPVPADAWEYQMRKALNDAVSQSLQYVAYSSRMPVDPNQPPKFMWARKSIWPRCNLRYFWHFKRSAYSHSRPGHLSERLQHLATAASNSNNTSHSSSKANSMAATVGPHRSVRAVLKGGQQQKRVPMSLKDDKHMQHGRLLLAAHQSPEPLERLLAVANFNLCLLTDMLRRSDDTQDIPVLVLGHHYISHRQLGEAGTPLPAALQHTAGTAATAAPAPGSAQVFRANLQELCTFDGEEGPKRFVGAQGVPLAVMSLAVEPLAVAKAKRLGRDLSIKVELSSGGSIGQLRLLQWGEDYSFSLPSLQLLAPLNPRCPIAFKGEMAISCPATGLSLTAQFSKDNTVSGTIDQNQPRPQTAAAATTAAPAGVPEQGNGSSGGAAASALPLLGRQSSGASKGQLVSLGSVSGSWLDVITVSCPKLGLEGVLYDSAAVRPAPVPSLDLNHLGPMRLSRLWSAIHDALLYADPRFATGGRAAAKLATAMSQYLRALTLESASSRDVGGGSGPSAAPGSSSAGGGGGSAAPPGSVASARRAFSSGAVSSGGTDSDVDEFDRQLEGMGRGGTEDRRDVPPCYKEQHAAGRKLRYVLHYTLTSLPSSTASTS